METHNEATLARFPGDEDDGVLAERVLCGDDAAFTRLVERYHGKLFRLVRGIVGDWHRSEDVCQEVFTIVFRKLGGFRGRSRLSTWVYRIAVNAALKARRKRYLPEVSSLSAVPPSADPRFRRIESDEVLQKLLAPLPENLRVAVVLRDQMGLNYEEMASVLGCSRGAVEQRLHRAMVALREIWKEADWTER